MKTTSKRGLGARVVAGIAALTASVLFVSSQAALAAPGAEIEFPEPRAGDGFAFALCEVVSLRAHGWDAGEELVVAVAGAEVDRITVGATGELNWDWTIPADLQLEYLLSLTFTGSSSGTAYYDIFLSDENLCVAPRDTGGISGDGSRDVPVVATGGSLSDSLPMLAVAASVLIAGAGVAVAARRRGSQ